MSTGQAEALDQLGLARHAGATHPPHLCFEIALPDDVSLIPESVVSPLSVDVRPLGTRMMATIDLYLAEGRMTVLDLSEVREPDEGGGQNWPDLQDLVLS